LEGIKMAELTWIVVQDYLTEYSVLIILGVVVIGFAIYKTLQKRKMAKIAAGVNALKHTQSHAPPITPPVQEQQQQQQYRQPEPTYQSPPQEYQREPKYGSRHQQDSLRDLFDKQKAYTTQTDPEDTLLNELGSITQIFYNHSQKFETGMTKEIDELKKEIVDAGNKKTLIKRYGLILAELYDKYEAREYQYGAMLVSMEQLIGSKK
jgi:hypothetical protein